MIDSELWPRIRILLVEDQLIVAEDVRQKLQALSYSVLDIVALGQDAIRRTGELRPDLVLMDIKLQGEIDGIETADQIRVQYDIPVVYLTGHLSDEILRRATGAEPFGFVCKPFEVRTLHSAIQVALARHQISRKLRASEARYRLVSELVSDYAYTFRVELDGSLVGEWVTEAFTRITGFTCDEMDARGGYMSLIHPDDVPIVLQRSQALVSNRPDVSEFRIVTRDGEMRWLRDHARPVWDEQQGRVIRIIGAAQDVTSRKQAEESLRQSESLLRSVLSSVPIFVFALDQQGTVTFAAGKGGPFAGAQPTRGVGQRILDLPHEGVDITEDIHRALAGDEFSSTVHVDGGRTFDARYSSLRDLQGEVFGVTGVVIDITERARVEQMLLESKSQLENQRRFIQRIVESIPSSLVVVDEARRIVSVNRNFLGKMRRDEQATLGCKLTQVFPKVLLDYTQLDQKVEMVFRTGQIFEGGTVAYRAPGLSTRIYYYRVVPLRGEESVENVMLLMDDITEQEQLRAEVRQAERHLASVVECADDMVISMDPQGHILTWNRAAARISGLEVEHVQGKPLPALCADEQRSTMARMLERLARGQGVQTTEVNLLTANQRRVPIAWNCSPMRNDTSEVTGIVVVGRDLTEQRSLEAQLLQSAKMVSLGVMAGGIAHELRNPLGTHL